MNFIQRLFQAPSQKSYFLFGPRGTGKSTLMHERYSNALWINLLDPEVHRLYLAYPERLYGAVDANPSHRIIIDEIQKAPALLSVVHDLIEKKRNLQFILTGSSARKLKRTGANLLGGRALHYALHPFMATELKEKFSLEHALKFGLLPLLLADKDPQAGLHAYISLYLREEIQEESLVRHLENFARFLEVVTFSHAGILNLANIARECFVKRKTVENYLNVLEELLLGFQLPVFMQRAQRAVSHHAKFYLFDAGVFQTLRPRGPLDRVTEVEGAALEGLVAQHLRAWNDYSVEKHQLAFWRTRSGVEVDFVVYGPKGFWALEVKNNARLSNVDIKPLQSFLQDYPQAKAILLYRGKELRKEGDVLCLPCEVFLKQLKPGCELLD